MHQKLQCLRPALVNRVGPILLYDNAHTASTLKVEQIGLRSSASSAIFTWPLTSWLPLLQASQQLFAEKMLPQPAGGRKCFQRVRWILKHGFLCYRNKQTLLLIGKTVLTVMVPIVINKDVFEPHYNDLKFRVWNHICTKLCLLRNLYAGQEATVELDMEQQTCSK